MKIIHTEDLKREDVVGQEGEWIYNGLDSLVSCEVHNALENQLGNNAAATYSFAMDLRAPLMEMMMRGVAVDADQRAMLIGKYRKHEAKLQHVLDEYGRALLGKPILANSHVQLKDLFYKKMGLPEQYARSTKGEKTVTVGREALEKLEEYFYARPIIAAVFAQRDNNKKLSVLAGRKSIRDALTPGDNVIGPDGRFYTSFNIGGTTSGRLSSSSSPEQTGYNAQNITDELRRIFIADPGKKLGYADLQSAESLGVGYLSGDANYIRACESGDPHTYVSKLCWPDLPWTGDLALDREIAERPYYRHFSYRDMAKRGGHASNYYATAWTIARHLKIPLSVAEEFQALYFRAFPGIRRWHQAVATQLQTNGSMTTALGFERFFFGRLFDDSTLREAIAFEPQSLIAFILNRGMLRIWKELHSDVELLLQIHDAVLFQYDPRREEEILPKVAECLRIPVEIGGKEMIIKSDATVGWNWAKRYVDKQKVVHNEYGLMKWKGVKDGRTAPAKTGILDQFVS